MVDHLFILPYFWIELAGRFVAPFCPAGCGVMKLLINR